MAESEPKKPELNCGMVRENLEESRRITDAIAAREGVGKIVLNVADGSVEEFSRTGSALSPDDPARCSGRPAAELLPVAIVRRMLERECRRRDDADVRAEMAREILLAIEGRGSR